MSRTKVEVNRADLVNAINAIENGEDRPTSRNQLFDRVAERMGITKSIAMLRINDLKIELTTPKGERGRPKGGTNKSRITVNGETVRDMSNSECLRPVFADYAISHSEPAEFGSGEDVAVESNQVEV